MGRHAGPAGGVARVAGDDTAPPSTRDDRGPIRPYPEVVGVQRLPGQTAPWQAV
jgi:hypothetical protein